MTMMNYYKTGIVFLLATIFSLNAFAETYTVNSNADSGKGSLREAITLANSNPGSEIYFNLPTGSETIIIESQLPTIISSLDIDGDNNIDGADIGTNVSVKVKTGGKYRVFQVSPQSNDIVNLEDMTVNGGDISSFTSDANGLGGSIYTTNGILNLTDLTLSGSKAYMGGALHTGGSRNPNKSVTISNCIISGNSAVWSGGIHAMATGSLKIYNSTIANNTATRYGGGICSTIPTNINYSTISNNKVIGTDYSYGGGITIASNTATINNSTISYNNADGGVSFGGGIYCESGTALLTNCTISSNTVSGANPNGGGIYSAEAGSLYLLNSIAVNNNSSNDKNEDIDSDGKTFAYYCWLNSVTGNIVSQTNAPNQDTPFLTGDISQLADNGGSTKTMALDSNCPPLKNGAFVYFNALDGFYFIDQTGISHKLIDWDINPSVVASDKITIDQRGMFRPSPATIGAYNPAQGIPPIIKKIKPNHSSAGKKVNIFGSALANVQKVTFGKADAKISGKASDNKVSVTVPSGTAGQTVDVTVTTAQGTNTLVNGFTYGKK